MAGTLEFGRDPRMKFPTRSRRRRRRYRTSSVRALPGLPTRKRPRFAPLAVGALLVLAATAVAQDIEPIAAAAAEPAARSAINFYDPLEVVRRGGVLIWPIILCSLVTITFGLERAVRLRRSRVAPGRFVKKFFRNLDRGGVDRVEALEKCQGNPSSVARMFEAGVRHWGRPTKEVRAAIEEVRRREIADLTRHLRTLQGSANIATLLGLLGTVIGMMQAFNMVADSQGLGRAEVLAGGIAVALLTTACGLAVAIPSLFLYTYFAGKIERLLQSLDTYCDELVERVSAEGLAGPAAKPEARRAVTGSIPLRAPAQTTVGGT